MLDIIIVDQRKLLLYERFSLLITIQYVLEHSDFIFLHLLFYLKDVNILWKTLQLFSTDGVDQGSLANSVPAN
jgi:hypothetical protein